MFKNAPRLADSEPVIVVNDLAYLFKTRTKSKDDKACAEFIKKTLIYDPEKRMRAREAFYDEYVKSAFLDPRVSILYNDHENWDRSFHEKRGNYVGTKDVLVGGRTHLPSPDEELN